MRVSEKNKTVFYPMVSGLPFGIFAFTTGGLFGFLSAYLSAVIPLVLVSWILKRKRVTESQFLFFSVLSTGLIYFLVMIGVVLVVPLPVPDEIKMIIPFFAMGLGLVVGAVFIVTRLIGEKIVKQKTS